MVSVSEDIRQAALKYVWLQNENWIQMAEEGGPRFWQDSQGVRVFDTEGNSFIDTKAGYASVTVGYGRTEIADAAYEQIVKTSHFPSGSTTIPAVKLAQKVADLAPGSLSRVSFVSGGSEANETAVKIARAYHRRRGDPGRYKVISRFGSYHGFSGLVMWTGGTRASGRQDYEPAYPGMVYAPQPLHYKCERRCETASECAIHHAKAVEDLILFHNPETVAAFMGEPVSAPLGAVVPGDEYWPMVREICDKYGVLLISDEVVCGFGRTGKMFGMDHWGVVPDIMAVAKGLVSSYMTIGAAVATSEVADVFGGDDNFFRHSLTFSGHPGSAAAALKNIEIIENENMVENAANVGVYLREQLEGLKKDHPIIGEVRGLGLLNAIDLVRDRETREEYPLEVDLYTRLKHQLLKNGLIPGGLDSYNYIALAPPLCVTRSEIDEIVAAVDRTLGEVERQLGVAK